MTRSPLREAHVRWANALLASWPARLSALARRVIKRMNGGITAMQSNATSERRQERITRRTANTHIVVVLVMTGLISVEQLREFRGYVIVAIFVVAAIVTPPDVVSQISLAVPMCLLYEVGIFFARFVEKRTKPEAGLGEPSRD